MNPSSRGGVTALLALGVVWGTNFVFMQMAAPYLSAGQTTLVRVLVGLVPVLALALATRALAVHHLRHVHHFAVQAVLAAGFYYYAYAAGTYRLDSSIAGALSGSIPVFATVAALFLFRTEPPTWRKVLGVLGRATGAAVLARPWSAGQIDATVTAWMLIGSASLGVSFGYARRFITPLSIPATAASTYQMVIAVVALTLLTDLNGITAITADPVALAGVVFGLGVVGTGLAFVLYYVAVNGLGALTASLATYIAPLVALAIGVALLDETLHPSTLPAVLLILGAAALTRRPSTVGTRFTNSPPPTEAPDRANASTIDRVEDTHQKRHSPNGAT